jgi:hypothetical protein|nr:MAG TPA: hypothetical protein [Caudoviricetes sp.]
MNTRTLLVILFLNIFYLFYRYIAKKIYINEISNLKEELFLKSVKIGIDTNSLDYLISELKLDIFIKMADTNTMLDFLFFKNFLMSKRSRNIEKEFQRMLNIKNPKMKELDTLYFEKAIRASKKNLFLGTITGLLYTFFQFLRLLFKTPKIKLKNRTFFEILKKIFDKIINVFKNEMFLETKMDYILRA